MLLTRCRFFLRLILGLLFVTIQGCGRSVTSVSEPHPVQSGPQFKVLQESVVLSPQLTGRVKSVRFFEGERSAVAFSKKRIYESRFARASTRTIYTEINLEHTRPGKNIYFPITLYFLRNGKTIRIEEIEGRLEPDWTSSEQVIGAGDFSPGKWRPGTYEVEVYIRAENVAKGFFEIYE